MSQPREPALETARTLPSERGRDRSNFSEVQRRVATVRPGSFVRRRRTVNIAKYALPVLALALLSSIALWPEISRTLENGRATWHRLTAVVNGTGELKRPRFRGFDGQNQPYMVSADTAQRIGPERVRLEAPRGDLTLHNGTWLQVQSRHGTYMQHADQLDLTDDVTLYRQDGTTMTTATATLDLKRGAATSSDYTHAEGSFGTLDAEGFTLVDKGGVVQFHGPAHLVLNGAH